MNQVAKVFQYQGAEVRTLVRDGEPWFVAKDVCDILEITNPTMALQRLDDDERSKFNLGRQGETNIVNESGLYELIFGSRKREAQDFKRWVKREVLPSIRKTGSYSVQPKTQAELLLMYAEQFVRMESRVDQMETTVTAIQETFLHHDEDWRKMINGMMKGASYRNGGNYSELRTKSYELLEERAKCNLDIRLNNLIDRLYESGASMTKIKKANKMDVIEAEPRLKEIYTTIVKELSIGSLQTT